MRIEKSETLALVVDIQERLVPAMDNSETFVKNCQILVQGLQELAVPIIVTQQYTKGLGETIPEIASLINDFSYIEKTSFSCYDEPAFVEAVEDINRKNVIISGIESHICVLQTAIELKAAGYNPIVVVDCVDSRADANKQIAMERFRHEGIMLTSYESILFELTQGAKTPEFKAISTLLK